jgi:hypothetical protein
LLLLAHLATLVPSVHQVVEGTGFFGVVQDAIYVLAGLVVGARAVLVRQDRWAWALLSLGLLSYAAGNVVAYAYIQHLDPQPYPSIADALWLPLYPLGYASVLLLLRRHTGRWQASMWLDGLVAAFGVGALAVALVLGPVLHATHGAFLPVVTNLAYPVADLLLLALVVAAFAVMGWRPSATWWLLGVGWVAFVVADSVYLLQIASDSYVRDSGVDSIWLVGVVPMALSAWVRPTSESGTTRPAGRLLLAVPLAFTSVGVGLLVVGNLRDVKSPTLLVVLSAATIVRQCCARR